MIINFKYPCLEILVYEDVKAKDLETVSLTLTPSTPKLELLLNQREWLHCKQALLTDFTYLLKQVVSVDLLLFLQVFENRGKWSFARLFNVIGVQVFGVHKLV